eukprot:COSAG05_NODE_102_length_19076_cov_21.766612_5_plen_148_part_00
MAKQIVGKSQSCMVFDRVAAHILLQTKAGVAEVAVMHDLSCACAADGTAPIMMDVPAAYASTRQMTRQMRPCTTDISLQNECAHVGLSVRKTRVETSVRHGSNLETMHDLYLPTVSVRALPLRNVPRAKALYGLTRWIMQQWLCRCR